MTTVMDLEAVVQVECAAGLCPSALLGSGTAGVSVPLAGVEGGAGGTQAAAE